MTLHKDIIVIRIVRRDMLMNKFHSFLRCHYNVNKQDFLHPMKDQTRFLAPNERSNKISCTQWRIKQDFLHPTNYQTRFLPPNEGTNKISCTQRRTKQDFLHPMKDQTRFLSPNEGPKYAKEKMQQCFMTQ